MEYGIVYLLTNPVMPGLVHPEYEHTLEGADDMPAHAKSVLSGVSLTIPITDGHLNLGTWQGIYFNEFRNYGGPRQLIVTIIG